MKFAVKAIAIILMLLSQMPMIKAQCDQPVRVMQYIPTKVGGWENPHATKRPMGGVVLHCSDAEAATTDSEGRAILHFKHLSEPDYVNLYAIEAPGSFLFSLDALTLWALNPSQEYTLLLISLEDYAKLQEAMPGFKSVSSTPRYRFFEPALMLLHTDVTTLEDYQKKEFALAAKGKVAEVLSESHNNDVIERYRKACLNGNEADIERYENQLDWQIRLLRLEGSKESLQQANQMLETMFEYRSCSLRFVDHYLQTCRSRYRYTTALLFIETQLNRPDISLTGKAYLNYWRGFFEVALGEASKAVGYLEEAYSSYEALAVHMNDSEMFPYRRAMTCQLLGQCYHELHQTEKMCFYHDRSIEFFQKAVVRDSSRRFQWGCIAMIIADNFYYDNIRLDMVDSLTNIAQTILDQEVAQNPQQYGSALMTIYGRAGGRLLNQNRPKEALELFEKVLEQAQTTAPNNDTRMVYNYANYYNMRSKAHYLLGDIAASDRELQIAIDLLTSADRNNIGSYRSTFVKLYLSKIRNLIAQERYVEARNLATVTLNISKQAFADNPETLKVVLAELNELNAKVKPSEKLLNQIVREGSADLFEFGFITDTHNFGTSADIRDADRNIAHFVAYCNDHERIQFAMHGGDFINSYDLNHDQAYWCLTNGRDQFSNLHVPFYTTRGNHDCNGKQWKGDKRDYAQIITDREYYELFSPLAESNPLSHPEGIVTDARKPQGNYYFRDFENQHMRIIVLNNYDRDTLEVPGYHDLQLRWFVEEAMDFSHKPAGEEWNVLIFGHYINESFSSPLLNFLEAYQHGATEWSGKDRGVKYRWSERRQHRAQLVGLITGHLHCDIYDNQLGFNMIGVTRGYATGGEVGYKDDCFDHFVVDTHQHLLYEYRVGRGQSRIYSYGLNIKSLDENVVENNNKQTFPVCSFPSAEGQGNYTIGGGDGRVLHVTHLGDEGVGSLRWAVEQQGARIVVFDQGGEIRLKRPLVIANDSISIYGQTAPRRGIAITGYPVRIEASEVIARYLTVAPDDTLDCDAISDNDFGQRAIVLDHITTGSTLRSGIAIRFTADATVQHCRIAPSISDRYASLVAGGFCTTYYSNYIHGSAKAVQLPDEPGCNRWIQISGNVVGNWCESAISGGCNQAEANIVYNYFLPSTQCRKDLFLNAAEDGTARYYLRGNVVKGREGLTQKGQRKLISDHAGLPFFAKDTTGWYRIDPIARPHANQYGFASSCVVIASFHNKEIVQDYTGEALYVYVSRTAGNTLAERPQSIPADSDGDGIPDGFQTFRSYLYSLTEEDRK